MVDNVIQLFPTPGGIGQHEMGLFSEDSGVFPPLSSYDVIVPLGRDDYQQGIIKFHLIGTASSRARITFIGFINRSEPDTHSKATDVQTYSIYGYLFDAWHDKGYHYAEDGKLSENEWLSGTVPLGGWRSYVKSVYIVGATIKITFYNPGTANSSRINISGVYQVWQ